MAGSLEVQVLEARELEEVLARSVEDGLMKDSAWREDVPAPQEPGVYVWAASGLVVYVGKAGSLADRLGYEQRLRDGYEPAGDRWEVSVVHMLRVYRAKPMWARAWARDPEAALKVERRLIEWHRACVGIAPLAIGWDTKPGSPREQAETMARELWNLDPAARPSTAGERFKRIPDPAEPDGTRWVLGEAHSEGT